MRKCFSTVCLLPDCNGQVLLARPNRRHARHVPSDRGDDQPQDRLQNPALQGLLRDAHYQTDLLLTFPSPDINNYKSQCGHAVDRRHRTAVKVNLVPTGPKEYWHKMCTRSKGRETYQPSKRARESRKCGLVSLYGISMRSISRQSKMRIVVHVVLCFP